MEVVLLIVVCFVLLILVAALVRPVIFFFEPLFSLLNCLLWIVQNPLRWMQKNINSGLSRGLFLSVTLTGVSIIWFVAVYIITAPARIVLALYYDVLLYISVCLSDSIQELVNPKMKGFRNQSGFKYFFRYLWTFPYRFVVFIFNGGIYILDSFLMLGVSIAFPTLTMRHGTNFESAGTKIGQTNKWYVGKGNFAGTGIYFGLNDKVANYYAPKGKNSGTVLVRVTLSFCKNLSSLSKRKRQVGLGERGEQLTEDVSTIYQAIEHYREGHNWWEYCLLRKGQMGNFTSSWRIRPVAITREGKISRLYGGIGHYSASTGLIAGVMSWAGILFVLVGLLS